MEPNGNKRPYDFEKDSISYRLRLKLSHEDNDERFIYVTGFDKAGKELWGTPEALYGEMVNDGLKEQTLIDELSNHSLEVMLSSYVLKDKQEVRWTLVGIKQFLKHNQVTSQCKTTKH